MPENGALGDVSAPNKPEENRMDEFTPRQAQFIEFWNDPKSETFGNAYGSALRAGYAESYAKLISSVGLQWVSEANARRMKFVEKAEKNLDKLLDSEDERVQADITKFTLTRLKKDEYSERSEITGKNGQPIAVKGAVTDEEFDSLMVAYGKRQEGGSPEEVI